jgi:hypothetical protein
MSASVPGLPTTTSVQTAYNPSFGVETIAVGVTFTSPPLYQDGLPQCNAYVLQHTPGSTEATVEFLQTPGIWLPFEAAIATTVDVPVLRNYALGAPAYRIRIENTGGAPVDVYWRLTATTTGT